MGLSVEKTDKVYTRVERAATVGLAWVTVGDQLDKVGEAVVRAATGALAAELLLMPEHDRELFLRHLLVRTGWQATYEVAYAQTPAGKAEADELEAIKTVGKDKPDSVCSICRKPKDDPNRLCWCMA